MQSSSPEENPAAQEAAAKLRGAHADMALRPILDTKGRAKQYLVGPVTPDVFEKSAIYRALPEDVGTALDEIIANGKKIGEETRIAAILDDKQKPVSLLLGEASSPVAYSDGRIAWRQPYGTKPEQAPAVVFDRSFNVATGDYRKNNNTIVVPLDAKGQATLTPNQLALKAQILGLAPRTGRQPCTLPVHSPSGWVTHHVMDPRLAEEMMLDNRYQALPDEMKDLVKDLVKDYTSGKQTNGYAAVTAAVLDRNQSITHVLIGRYVNDSEVGFEGIIDCRQDVPMDFRVRETSFSLPKGYFETENAKQLITNLELSPRAETPEHAPSGMERAMAQATQALQDIRAGDGGASEFQGAAKPKTPGGGVRAA